MAYIATDIEAFHEQLKQGLSSSEYFLLLELMTATVNDFAKRVNKAEDES